MKVSVIIPAYNEENNIGECLDSIHRQTKNAYEVIVVDNNSIPDAAQIIASFGFKRLSEDHHQGSQAAHNAGVATARGAFLAFTHSDCEVATDWLRQLQRAAVDNPQAGCIAGEIILFPAATSLERYSNKTGPLLQRVSLSGWHFKPYAQTANAAYRREVFDCVGRFDPTTNSGGDALIAWRMLDNTAYTIMFAPDAKVYRRHRTDVAGLWSQFSHYGRDKVSWAREWDNYVAPDPDDQEAALMQLMNEHAQAIARAGLDEEKFLFPLYSIAAKSAHYAGYLRAMLTRLNPGAAPAAIASPALASQTPLAGPTPKRMRCPICGGASFEAGPGGRLVCDAAPLCIQCGSLERHRVLHDLLSFFHTIGSEKASCVTIGERPRNKNPGFARFEHFDNIASIQGEGAHLIVGCELFSRADSVNPEAAISILCDHLEPEGLVLIMQASGPLSPRTQRRENSSWNLGADFAWLASLAAPDASILSGRGVDSVTNAAVAFTAISHNSKLLRDLALYLERSSGSATYISI